MYTPTARYVWTHTRTYVYIRFQDTARGALTCAVDLHRQYSLTREYHHRRGIQVTTERPPGFSEARRVLCVLSESLNFLATYALCRRTDRQTDRREDPAYLTLNPLSLFGIPTTHSTHIRKLYKTLPCSVPQTAQLVPSPGGLVWSLFRSCLVWFGDCGEKGG